MFPGSPTRPDMGELKRLEERKNLDISLHSLQLDQARYAVFASLPEMTA